MSMLDNIVGEPNLANKIKYYSITWELIVHVFFMPAPTITSSTHFCYKI